MKSKVVAVALGSLLAVGASAAAPPNQISEPVQNATFEAPVAPAAGITALPVVAAESRLAGESLFVVVPILYNCYVLCDSGSYTIKKVSSASSCASTARHLCRPEGCEWEFEATAVGTCG